MDVLKLGTAALLAVAFAGALLVRDQPASEVAALPLPSVCGDVHSDHGGVSMQEHLDVMAEGQSEELAALIQTMEPMHSDMMQGAGMTAADPNFRPPLSVP